MILVFDAKCLLCCAWVRFVLKHDRRRVFRFASIQSEAGMALLARAELNADELQTLLLVDGERCHQYTSAIFRVLHQFGFPWRLAWLGWLVPSLIRDSFYRWLARNRYRLFGRRDVCFLPRPEESWRFLKDIPQIPRPQTRQK
jgi:predicted DCC family thiol-disulfide oxidoreductase YuxK